MVKSVGIALTKYGGLFTTEILKELETLSILSLTIIVTI